MSKESESLLLTRDAPRRTSDVVLFFFIIII